MHEQIIKVNAQFFPKEELENVGFAERTYSLIKLGFCRICFCQFLNSLRSLILGTMQPLVIQNFQM